MFSKLHHPASRILTGQLACASTGTLWEARYFSVAAEDGGCAVRFDMCQQHFASAGEFQVLVAFAAAEGVVKTAEPRTPEEGALMAAWERTESRKLRL